MRHCCVHIVVSLMFFTYVFYLFIHVTVFTFVVTLLHLLYLIHGGSNTRCVLDYKVSLIYVNCNEDKWSERKKIYHTCILYVLLVISRSYRGKNKLGHTY